MHKLVVWSLNPPPPLMQVPVATKPWPVTVPKLVSVGDCSGGGGFTPPPRAFPRSLGQGTDPPALQRSHPV